MPTGHSRPKRSRPPWTVDERERALARRQKKHSFVPLRTYTRTEDPWIRSFLLNFGSYAVALSKINVLIRLGQSRPKKVLPGQGLFEPGVVSIISLHHTWRAFVNRPPARQPVHLIIDPLFHAS